MSRFRRSGRAPGRTALALTSAVAGGLGLRTLRDRTRLEAAARRERLVAEQGALLLERERAGLSREQDAARRALFVAEVAQLIDEALDPRATLDGVARLAVPEMAELCVIDLVDDKGRLAGDGVASATDPAVADAIRAARSRSPLTSTGPHPAAVAARTGDAQLFPELSSEQLRSWAASESHFETMQALHYRSAVVVPLIARGHTLGVVTLIHIGERRYSPEDLAATVEVAGRAALALDNARLFADLRSVEAQQEAILAGMDQVVTAQDRDGNIVFANQAAADALGYDGPADLLQASIADIWSRFTVTDELGRPVPASAYPARAALAGETPLPIVVRSVELTTGSVRWTQVRATAVRDERGEVVMAVTVADDVTAVKRAETAQRFLASASKLLGATLDVDATVSRAAATAVPALADWCWVDVLDAEGHLMPAALAHPEDAPAEHIALARSVPRLRSEDPRSPWRVLRSGRALTIPDVPQAVRDTPPDDERLTDLALRLGLQSIAIVPMMAGERTIGVLSLATAASGRVLNDDTLDLALDLGRRAGMAIDHARVHATSEYIAETLQRSLLPRRLPEIPGLRIAARFRPAGEGTAVGGDFYDAFAARGGWMVVMGDVTGKGPQAAAITARARDTMRTAAAYEDGPRAVLSRLNATLAEEPEPRVLCSALAVLVGLPAADGVPVTLSLAGHPQPMLGHGGAVREVGDFGSLLGAADAGDWHEVRFLLAPGDTLVLFTDGVTDARGAEGHFGPERLSALLESTAGLSAEATADRVDEAVAAFQEGPQLDDLALLVVRAD